MKVLILTTTFPRWKDDTTPAFIYNLAKELVKQGLEVVVLAPHYKGAKKFEIMNGVKVYRFQYFFPASLQKVAYDGGILPNLKRSLLAKIQLPLFFLAELVTTFMVVKKENIDVINSHWMVPSGLIGAICRKVFGVTHVATEHAAGLVGLDKLLFKQGIASFIIKNSDKLTVVSSYMYKKLLETVSNTQGKSIRVIPMGINVTSIEQNLHGILKKITQFKGKYILLFIGRFTEKKGLPYLIKALSEIISRNPNCLLVACGNGPQMPRVKKLVMNLKLDKFVIFPGYVSEEEKNEYLLVADVLVVPSIVTDSGDTEGLPVVILEGFSKRKPIVASDVGGIRDAILDRKTGFLVKQKNSKELAEKINILLLNPKLRRKFSIRGYKKAIKDFSWERIGEKFSKTYDERHNNSCFNNGGNNS